MYRQPGDVVAGRFTLEKLAGGGGMGEIYRAIDRRDGSRVALKILQGQDPEERVRFASEARRAFACSSLRQWQIASSA